MTASTARLGGERANRIVERIIDRYDAMVALLVDEYGANGFPPFTVPLTPYEQFQKLTAMRGAGDPQFWQNPAAQQALAKLEAQFAPAAAVSAPYAVSGEVPLGGLQ